MTCLGEFDLDLLSTLSTAAMKDFCDGYDMMFEKKIRCKEIAAETLPLDEIRVLVSGIIAVNTYTFTGKIQGSFLIVFDKPALFIMGGTTIMLPAVRIKENAEKGDEEEASFMADSVGEIGNLLAGSYAKMFRDGHDGIPGFDEHLRLILRLPINIGKVQLELTEEMSRFHMLTYQMELDQLPSFSLRVIFPAASHE